MPKLIRNSNLTRVVRRRIATSNDIPTLLSKKIPDRDTGTVQMKGFITNHYHETEIVDLEKKLSGNKKEDSDKRITNNGGGNGTKSGTAQQLSRGQRKRQAKREQFLKKENMILSSLILRRQEEQKKRIDGLDAIKQALMDTANSDENDPNLESATEKLDLNHISNNKAKRQLVAKEIEHVNLILQHPAFKKDPFATMQEHLKNSFAEDRKCQKELSKKRTEQEKQKLEKKRAEKKGIKKKTQKKKYKPRRTR